MLTIGWHHAGPTAADAHLLRRGPAGTWFDTSIADQAVTPTSHRLVLMRHGRTDATDSKVLVGWLDPPLNEAGLAQSAAAADILREHQMLPDRAHCSELIRAVRTCQILLAALGRAEVPVRSSWYLNERHYGALDRRPSQPEPKAWKWSVTGSAAIGPGPSNQTFDSAGPFWSSPTATVSVHS